MSSKAAERIRSLQEKAQQDPGTYSINMVITGLDASLAGHVHGNPPEEFWGVLTEADEDYHISDDEASCQIEVDDSRTGSCDVSFHADEISGVVTVHGTAAVGGQVVSTDATITVEVPNLSLLPPLSTYKLTGDTDSHPVNHWAQSATLTEMQAIAEEFNRSLPDAETYRRLGVNDASLVLGGLFDVGFPWDNSAHMDHRNGVDIDIDQPRYDASGHAGPWVPCLSDIRLDNAIQKVLGRKGLLCESAGLKHINF
jgi:hypothetical protein